MARVLHISVVCGLLLSCPHSLLSKTLPRYEIEATYHHDQKKIEGQTVIHFENGSSKSIDRVYLLLYPNIYEERDPEVPEDLYTKAYPKEFTAGSMKILWIETEDRRLLPSVFTDLPRMKKRTLLQLPLSLHPGEKITISVAFSAQVPEKLGPFGYFNKITTLQGGWHPLLPSFENGEWGLNSPLPLADFHVSLTFDKRVTLVSSGQIEGKEEKGELQTVRLQATLSFFTLIFSESYEETVAQEETLTLSYFHLPGDRRYAKEVLQSSQTAIRFFRQKYGEIPLAHLRLAESPLYQDLVTAGEDILLVGNRIFKVFPPLKPYHEGRLAKGIFFLLWRARLPLEEDWVIEGMASRTSRAYLTEKYRKTLDLEGKLRFFSFIPLIDQILYSRLLPLRQVYFKDPAMPLLREDVRLFNNGRPDGSMIFGKMETLITSRTFDKITTELIREGDNEGRPTFRAMSQAVSGRDLKPFYTQWLTSPPTIDFELEEITQEKSDGGYRTRVSIRKKGEGAEPVKILMRQKDRKEFISVWDGTDQQYEGIFTTPSPLSSVEVDPDHETLDPNRLNNRRPHQWKVLLERLGVKYDFQTGTEFNTEVFLQRVHDAQNVFNLSFSSAEEEIGGEIGYTRLLISRILPGYQHSLSGRFSFVRSSLARDGEDEAFRSVGLSYTIGKLGVPIYSETLQKLLGGKFPSTLSGEYEQKISGDPTYALRLIFDLKKTFSLPFHHTVSIRYRIGLSTGTFSEARRFFLGGSSLMRGYTPLSFVGENISLLSLEYRFPVTPFEMTYNLSGLALLRGIRGAVFGDLGTVSDSRLLFRFTRYRSDIGGGLRFYLDAGGLYPTIIRFDVAHPFSSPLRNEEKPHYYLSLGLPF